MATLALGGEAVAVEPSVNAVGFNDIGGTAGEVYWPTVNESPDPPAR